MRTISGKSKKETVPERTFNVKKFKELWITFPVPIETNHCQLPVGMMKRREGRSEEGFPPIVSIALLLMLAHEYVYRLYPLHEIVPSSSKLFRQQTKTSLP